MKPEARFILASRTLLEVEDEGYVVTDLQQASVPLPDVAVPGLDVIRLARIPRKPIRWLWPGYIPHGSLTLIIGDPGLGKSQVTLDLAARVTRGTPWPSSAGDTPEIANVLLLASEDSLNSTVIPRLEASGAELERIIVLNETTDATGKNRKMFDLKKDLDSLEALIVQCHIEMIVLDPLNGYIGNANTWRESEVRNVLMPVRAIAERHDVAVIGVIHLTKDNAKAAIHRAQGSVAFAAVARAMFAVAAHPTYQGLRYFVSVKQNYAQHPPTLGFVLGDGGGLAWDDRSYTDVTADSLLAVMGAPEDKAERRNAKAWLAATLESGPVRTKDIVRLAKQCAITDRALHRAKYDLKAGSFKVGVAGTVGGGYWEWRLP